MQLRWKDDWKFAAAFAWVALSLAIALPAAGDATLSILQIGAGGPYPPGSHVQVRVRVSDVPPRDPAAGFQAFLRFDEARMSFVSGTYTAAPFGLHIIDPITASGENINLSAGINTFIGQPPSAADADLAVLTFEILTLCGVGAVEFRPNLPPSRLTNAVGQSILPIALVDLSLTTSCAGDVVASGVVDVTDLLLVIGNWGACPPEPECCAGNTNADAVVNVTDLLQVIGDWGACP